MTTEEKANKVNKTLDLIDYDLGLFDTTNFTAVVILCCAVKEIEDDELDSNGEMVVGCESDEINSRLSDAFFERRVREQFIKELEEQEDYELLACIKNV